jgi:DNA-binding NarL/FixJ family response regulator
VSTLQAAPHPVLPHSISEPLSDLAYDLTVIYGLRLRLVTRHGHDVPIHAAPRPARGSPLDELTAGELRVARLVAHGASNREVADWLSLSAKTVESHLSRIYRKLRVRSRAGVAYLVGQAER